MDDSEIIKLIQDTGTRHKGFELLMKKYHKKIYWHVRRMVLCHDDADDVTQNTFIKAWKGLDKYRNESSLHTWLYRIAINESLTFIEKVKRVQTTHLDDAEFLFNRLCNDPYFSGDEVQKKLHKALLTLPEKQRIVFNLKYFDELTYDEISLILNTSVGALKASYHHAVNKIEEFIKNAL